MENRINMLSVFNGMGCAEIALIECGIKYNMVYTSEIDKHALNQTRLNFPNDIELGDVRDIDVSKLERIDLFVGGSPCQSFSFAGKRKGMATKCSEEIYTLDKYLQLKADGFEFEGQSYLFWEYMRILTDIRKYNPNVLFLLENVEMGSKWERVLSEAIGVYGVHINSALVSAQNRKRIYWTNIRVRQEGLFGELHPDIPQPADRGILLKDILEKEVPEKYYLSDKMLNYFDKIAANFNNGKVNIRDENDKATTITASCKSVDISDNFVIDTNGRIDDKKTGTLTARYWKGTDNYSSNPYIVTMRGRGENNDQQLEPNYTRKTNTITSVQKDNLVMQLNPSKESGGLQPYQQNRVYDPNGICPCLNTDSRPHAILELNERQQRNLKSENEKADTFLSTSWKGSQANGMTLVNQTRIRRLTPTECARLQTIPDWYIWACSDTQQYRMLGNGWTVAVIMHIFSFLPDKFKTP